MGQRDVKHNVDFAVSFAQSGNRTSGTTGSSKRVDKYHGAAAVLYVDSYTDGTHDFTLQESDDDSTWNDVASSDIDGSFPSVTGSGDTGVHKVGYTGNKKYLRVKSSTSGTSTGADYGTYIIPAYPSYQAAT